MDLLREAMRQREQDEKHDAMEDRLRLGAAEAAAHAADQDRRHLQVRATKEPCKDQKSPVTEPLKRALRNSTETC